MLLIVCFLVNLIPTITLEFGINHKMNVGNSMNEQGLRALLSANIKRFRGRRGWSQAKLAEKLDISTNFLSDIETTKGWVSPLTLVKLAAALNVEVYELFKPENSVSGDLKDVVNKLAQDLTTVLTESVEYTRKQYTEENKSRKKRPKR
jgi:transcriptional regulator with XRE-family HTH domain